jgi:hypothetical protein
MYSGCSTYNCISLGKFSGISTIKIRESPIAEGVGRMYAEYAINEPYEGWFGERIMRYEEFLANIFSCPECRGRMREDQRKQEHGSIFIWFKCRRPECSGQWLKKIPVMGKQAVGR